MVSYPGVDKDIQLATLKRELYARSHNQNNPRMGKTRRKRRTKRGKRREPQV